ncbi:hypothetical protein WH47_09021 [Habropoda laboriosa]|uniref:Uncharacterized protein n=1 Tax=Habropoda laboriosa TaxID=597456 RepID=A0A0L7QNN0_9HYME|nr:hypothetical protein WH47_09021 [Habropoda laboriosa]
MKGLNVCLLVVMAFVLVAIEDTESKKMTIEDAKRTIRNLRKVCAKKNDTPKGMDIINKIIAKKTESLLTITFINGLRVDLLDGQHRGEFPKDERLMCYMRCILTTTKSAVVRADDNDAIMEAVKEQTDACVEELQITKEDIEKLLNNDVEDDLREKAGCLKACVMRSTGIFENGVINIDNVQKMLEKAFPESPAKIAEKLDITRQCIEKDQDNVIAKYMEYLMPEVKPCADEFHITEEAATNIQRADSGADMRQMGCLKACVMKRMGILTGLDFHMEPILKMIDVVHADNPADKDMVIKIANDCTAESDSSKLESVFQNGKLSKQEPKEFLNDFGCLIACAFEKAKITTAEAEDTMPKLIRSLADLFSISTDAASSCVHSTMATIEDMRLFEDSLAEKVDTFGGISIRKASCTLACCAQAQGTVVHADDNVLSSCMEKMGLTIGDLPSLFRDNTDEGRRKRGCVEACIMQGLGLMNGNVIDMQKISEQIDKVIDDDEKKESARKAVQECVDEGDLPSLFRDNTDEGRRKRGCVEACIMQGLGLMNGNVIDMQKISEQIDKVIDDDEKKESARKAVQECVDEEEDYVTETEVGEESSDFEGSWDRLPLDERIGIERNNSRYYKSIDNSILWRSYEIPRSGQT